MPFSWAQLLATAASVGSAASLLQRDAPAGQGVLEGKPDCQYTQRLSLSSRPGIPCVPAPALYPWKSNTPWRSELGDRIVAAVIPRVSEHDCHGVTTFGDSTWCNKAVHGKSVIGLSYGIKARDLWSEKMANLFKVPTRLFDCVVDPGLSPPMAGTAQNATGKCGDESGPHCYETPYRSSRTCIGAKKASIEGRQYDTLFTELAKRRPLSVHLKMDVEGSEWVVLEQLLSSPKELAKIRTLDMKVHFGFNPSPEGEWQNLEQQALIEKQVRILEQLRKKMTVVGSTLEVDHQMWHPEHKCPHQCGEPVVHMTGGMEVTQFAVSYVSPAILKEA